MEPAAGAALLAEAGDATGADRGLRERDLDHDRLGGPHQPVGQREVNELQSASGAGHGRLRALHDHQHLGALLHHAGRADQREHLPVQGTMEKRRAGL